MNRRRASLRTIRRVLWMAGPFEVSSSPAGFQVRPVWQAIGPPACSPPRARAPAGDCTDCGTPHMAGVFDRIHVAKVLEQFLNDVAGRYRGGIRTRREQRAARAQRTHTRRSR